MQIELKHLAVAINVIEKQVIHLEVMKEDRVEKKCSQWLIDSIDEDIARAKEAIVGLGGIVYS